VSLLLAVLLWTASCSRITVPPSARPAPSPTPTAIPTAQAPSQPAAIVTTPALSGGAPPPVDAYALALQQEKLQLENAKLRIEATKIVADIRKLEDDSPWPGLVANIVTPIVAILAFTFTVYSFRKGRAADEEKRLAEMLEARFASAVGQLGSKERGAQVGGAAVLRFFLRKEPRYVEYHRPVFNVAAAHLRLQARPVPGSPTPDPLIRELGHVLRLACPLARTQGAQLPGDALLDATHVRLPYAHLVGADLRDVRMSHAHLQGVELLGANLTGAELIRTDVSGATLDQAQLCRSKLAHVRAVRYGRPDGEFDASFADACFWKADLTGANLKGANLNNTRMHEAVLTLAILDDALFSQAELLGTNLVNAQCESTQFVGAKFDGADLTGANLREANLTGASLADANLTGANLREANLTGVNIEHATSLQGTILIGALGLDDPELRAACLAKGAILS
jgi:uncharacterized protein YjbI with pentapeptide repeats